MIDSRGREFDAKAKVACLDAPSAATAKEDFDDRDNNNNGDGGKNVLDNSI